MAEYHRRWATPVSPQEILALSGDEETTVGDLIVDINDTLTENWDGNTIHVSYPRKMRMAVVAVAAREFRKHGWGVKVDELDRTLTFWMDKSKRVELQQKIKDGLKTPDAARPEDVLATAPVPETDLPAEAPGCLQHDPTDTPGGRACTLCGLLLDDPDGVTDPEVVTLFGSTRPLDASVHRDEEPAPPVREAARQ